jgi:hypothetical protein
LRRSSILDEGGSIRSARRTAIQLQQAPRVSSIRILARRHDHLRRVAKIRWSSRDASIYILPYGPEGTLGHVGVHDAVPPEGSFTFDFLSQGAGMHPKLSLHQSGQVHATCEGYSTWPVFSAPLFSPGGGHIASIVCLNPEQLPEFATQPRGLPRVDVVLDLPSRYTTMHVALFANIVEDRLPECPIRLRLIRPSMPMPLHIGIQFRGDNAASDGSGVGVLGGWGPDASPIESIPLVYAITGTVVRS